MAHGPIDEIMGGGGGNSVKKTLDKWGYTPGKGFASTSSQQNTGKNTIHENSNDRLKTGGEASGALGGAENQSAIGVTGSTQSGDSNTNQDSSSRNPNESVIATLAFSETSRATGSSSQAPVDGQISALFNKEFGPVETTAERRDLNDRIRAANAVATKLRGAGEVMSEDTIKTIATTREGIDVTGLANGPTLQAEVDPTQVKGKMAEGDSVDIG